MPDSYSEFEATTLFCPRCRKAVPVRKKLLLVLPTGTKYDYLCSECGAPVGAKVDSDPAEFRRTASLTAGAPMRPGLAGRPGVPPGPPPRGGRFT